VSLAVVIPTRGRAATLERTLAAIAARRGEVGALELVVVEDGTEVADASAIESAAPGAARLERLAPPGRGPAAARNRGVALARAERVLLLGDDTAPAPGCLALHDAASGGLQGRVDWDPARPVSEVMRFLAPRGPQFWFDGLEDGGELPYTALLGSNYSAPRAWFVAEPFDESFGDAAFEDTELAWRFRARRFVSRWSERAVAWHDHPYDDIAPFLARQRRAGSAARRAVALHPALVWVALWKPLLVHAAKAMLPSRRASPERDWDRRARSAYLAGYFAGPAAG
jgi:glycosyltransferase involved in cell wall biosynthesis